MSHSNGFLICQEQDLHLFFSAWTTAAVDNERVIGAMPIVMDILNIHRVRFFDESPTQKNVFLR